MKQTECVAMLLAGGEGTRLGKLTANIAKPAVHFGGKYRIIDFTLSNCTNSGIDTVGVLTQYKPMTLHNHIGAGAAWDLDRSEGGVTMLSPSTDKNQMNCYTGTANAVYQNLAYLEQHNPEYVLIISGDHIYNMDYRQMLDYHKQKQADATISVIEVKWEEASRFGIMSTNAENEIIEFAEKPAKPKSNLASMGIYIFKWDVLKSYLLRDENTAGSSNDFGKDVIPGMIGSGAKVFAYPFQGYWKDVGTIGSLWDAHMDLLDGGSDLMMNDPSWPLYTNCPDMGPHFVSAKSIVSRSMVSDGCRVYGDVDHSVLFHGVEVGEGSVITDSIIMPNVVIGQNVVIHKAIIGEGTVIRDGVTIGEYNSKEIVVIGENEVVFPETDKLPQIFKRRDKVLMEKIG